MVSFVICMQSISFHIYILRASWKISYYLHVLMYMFVLNVVTLKKLGFYLLTYTVKREIFASSNFSRNFVVSINPRKLKSAKYFPVFEKLVLRN